MPIIPLTRDEERSDAIEAIETAFRTIASQGWEPDRWQRLNLLRAIEDLRCGRYLLGEFMADHAMVPLEHRSDEGLPEEAVLVDITIASLHEAFEHARSLGTLSPSRGKRNGQST